MQLNLLEPFSPLDGLNGGDRPPTSLSAVTFIGTYAPRQCGIATFTQDLRNALIGACPALQASVAMLAGEFCNLHPAEVEHVVVEKERAAYGELREELNGSGTEAVPPA